MASKAGRLKWRGNGRSLGSVYQHCQLIGGRQPNGDRFFRAPHPTGWGGGAGIDVLKAQFVSLFLLLEELTGFVGQSTHHRGGRLDAALCHAAGQRRDGGDHALVLG